jgi:hypothetical protein
MASLVGGPALLILPILGVSCFIAAVAVRKSRQQVLHEQWEQHEQDIVGYEAWKRSRAPAKDEGQGYAEWMRDTFELRHPRPRIAPTFMRSRPNKGSHSP